MMTIELFEKKPKTSKKHPKIYREWNRTERGEEIKNYLEPY
jgi:hypothetical protein